MWGFSKEKHGLWNQKDQGSITEGFGKVFYFSELVFLIRKGLTPRTSQGCFKG